MKLAKYFNSALVVLFTACLMVACAGDSKDTDFSMWNALAVGEACSDEVELVEDKDLQEALEFKYNKDQSYDIVWYGMRLVLSYDAEIEGFAGTLESLQDVPVCNANVIVSLDNGMKIGLTKPIKVDAKEKIDIRLPIADAYIAEDTTDGDSEKAEDLE